jgi:hypothetical protein
VSLIHLFLSLSRESLIGTEEFALGIGSQIKLHSPDERVLVDARGPGEWIVFSPEGGRSLHVYRLEPCDWLVSEVGVGNEGRGRDLQRALRMLATAGAPPDWWDAVVGALSVAAARA